MEYFVGIDLHSDSNFIGIIDQKDRSIFRKKLPNDLNVIKKDLKHIKHISGGL